MKILHIISSSGMYGAEAVILNLSRSLRRGGHTIVLGVFSNSSNPNLQLHQAAHAEGIESHLIPCAGQLDRSVFQRIRDLVASLQPDIVHAHGYKADIYVYLALRRSGLPLVSTCHNWIDADLTVKLYGAADRLILRRYSRVVAVSGEVRQRLLGSGVDARKIRFIRNGIDLIPYEEATPSLPSEFAFHSDPVVGFIGRLSREKGADLFLRAAALVLRKVPSAKFVVVGEGPDTSALQSFLRESGIEPSVHLLGRRENMPGIYASLDLMVSSSRIEGLPMAILEGMASGLPLVATSVGQVPEVIVDGRSGILVPPEEIDALVSAIVSLLENPSQRRLLGIAARQRVRDSFSADRMAADYLSLYQEAISSADRTHAASATASPAR